MTTIAQRATTNTPPRSDHNDNHRSDHQSGHKHAGVTRGLDHRLTCTTVESFATTPTQRASFSANARLAMAASQDALRTCHERGDEIYGLTTGFGPHVRYAADADAVAQGAGLIAHLGAGAGEPASAEIVRATMLIRAQAIALAHSGIDTCVADALLELLHAGVVPAVPTIGSVGASGDLCPLSHIARVLMGDGFVIDPVTNTRTAAGPVLERCGLAPLALTGRDALALVNGTAFMSAYLALTIVRAERLVGWAERLTGWMYRQLGCRSQALDPRLHAARGHPGQVESARTIFNEANAFGTHDEDTSRPLQEVYSLRCAPQILGACRDQIDSARETVEREINGINDNPLVIDDAGGPRVIHGGNFQGQQIAFAADMANAAVVQAALLVERQIDVLCNPELTGANLLLAWEPGATSGMAGAQLTATAIAAEMRINAQHAAISTIPTNGRNQDIVSMGTLASRQAFAQLDRFASILSIAAIGVHQLDHLRRSGRCPGRVTPPINGLPSYKPFELDRPMHDDIAELSGFWIGRDPTSSGTE